MIEAAADRDDAPMRLDAESSSRCWLRALDRDTGPLRLPGVASRAVFWRSYGIVIHLYRR